MNKRLIKKKHKIKWVFIKVGLYKTLLNSQNLPPSLLINAQTILVYMYCMYVLGLEIKALVNQNNYNFMDGFQQREYAVI